MRCSFYQMNDWSSITLHYFWYVHTGPTLKEKVETLSTWVRIRWRNSKIVPTTTVNWQDWKADLLAQSTYSFLLGDCKKEEWKQPLLSQIFSIQLAYVFSPLLWKALSFGNQVHTFTLVRTYIETIHCLFGITSFVSTQKYQQHIAICIGHLEEDFLF